MPRLSWWLLILDKTNVIVTSLTACTVLYTRSPGVAFFAVGAVACSLTAKLLKRVIRQPRPLVHGGGRQKMTYGMPSTHSSVITFFAVYIHLACSYLPTHPSLPSNPKFRDTVVPFVTLRLAALVVISRVGLGYHTWPQVCAGVLYGIIFSFVWFKLWIRLDAMGLGDLLDSWVA